MAKTFFDTSMNCWSESDVKEWINTLPKFNDKQKQTINDGIDECGLDGDILSAVSSFDDLKDALGVPVILAKRLYQAITQYRDNESIKQNQTNNNNNNNNIDIINGNNILLSNEGQISDNDDDPFGLLNINKNKKPKPPSNTPPKPPSDAPPKPPTELEESKSIPQLKTKQPSIPFGSIWRAFKKNNDNNDDDYDTVDEQKNNDNNNNNKNNKQTKKSKYNLNLDDDKDNIYTDDMDSNDDENNSNKNINHKKKKNKKKKKKKKKKKNKKDVRERVLDVQDPKLKNRLTFKPDSLTLDDSKDELRVKMDCGHIIGPNTMFKYLEMLFKSDEYNWVITCPIPKCGKFWDFDIVSRVADLDNAEYIEYIQKIDQRKQLEYIKCPVCTAYIDKPFDGSIKVKCLECNSQMICYLCLNKWKDSNSDTVCGNDSCETNITSNNIQFHPSFLNNNGNTGLSNLTNLNNNNNNNNNNLFGPNSFYGGGNSFYFNQNNYNNNNNNNNVKPKKGSFWKGMIGFDGNESRHHQTALSQYIAASNSKNLKYGEAQLIELPSKHDQYTVVKNSFQSTCTGYRILNIYLVRNDSLTESYEYRKHTIARVLNNSKDVNELMLWHGTGLDNISKIITQGFLRQFGSRAAYGSGIYFAKNASYSANPSYAKKDAGGVQHMFYCSVICGEWCVGNQQMKIPSTKPNSQHIPYETTVDNVNSPSIFVTYKDDQAKACFLVSFKA